jgi:3-hydroxyacyl-CoA dehydrogenase
VATHHAVHLLADALSVDFIIEGGLEDRSVKAELLRAYGLLTGPPAEYY